MAEQWRPVPGHERYEVSDLGRVRNARTGYVLALIPHSEGYVMVHLGRRARCQLVHRLVCAAFHGPPPATMPRPHADHIDFDPTNNRPSNLRWLPHYLNEWRWKGYGDPTDPEAAALSAEQSAALDRELEAAGW